LGNNHILNFGQAGVSSTKKYLDDANVQYFGAPGGNKSAIKNVNGVNIAFVSYNEFLSSDIIGEQNATIDEIKVARKSAGIVVVFCHWGVEYNLKNTDSQKTLARQFIDAGADLVIGSHPHVIEPMEIYNGKRIYYSLGNFIFDQYFSEDVRKGEGVVVTIDKKTKQLNFVEKHFYLEDNGQTVEKTE
jgi:poly-gamma-glutamate synthesis protein (capsule biosynthesis protein)